MDAYEATKIVFQRIQTLDPQNASKIMGFLLIQDNGEKEMIRLAFGSESLLRSVIVKTKKDLGLGSSPNTPSTPSSPFGNGNRNPFSLSRQNSSSRIPSPLSITNGSNHPFSSSWTNSCAPYGAGGEVDLIDELHLQDQLSFLNDGSPRDFFRQDLSSPSPTGDGPLHFADAWGGSAGLHHRRSCSVSDIGLNPDDPSGGFGWKPCLFYARGYCKNGTACRFLHGETAADAAVPPSKLEMLEQQCQQLMASNSNFPFSPVGANKGINFLQFPPESPRGLSMIDRMQKFGQRGDFGMNCLNPGARQIYLTFPAESAFKEEDVSNYFSNFGPVQDVRIPYQQKRMFGFVTFDFPETVKLILAKGNPHFVCDARVLVKPYKEKAKIPDKNRKQMETPTGLDSRDPYDFQLGATRMFYNNTKDMLQQAIELQSRRLMGLQLLDVKRNGSNNNSHHHRTLSTGTVISSPTAFSPTYFSFKEGNGSIFPMGKEKEAPQQPTVYGVESDKDYSIKDDHNFNGKDSSTKESGSHESSEHNLPDSPFASPKASGGYATAFSNGISEAEKGISTNNNLITGPSLFRTNSPLDAPPFKSCYFQVPSFASGHETIGT